MSNSTTAPVVGGASPGPVPPGDTAAGPRIPHRVTWLDLPGPYGEAGMRVLAWINFPQRLAVDLQSGDDAAAEAALHQIVLEHNGWCDEQGEPLPPASDPNFWTSDALSTELAACVLAVIQTEALRLPNSLAPTRRR